MINNSVLNDNNDDKHRGLRTAREEKLYNPFFYLSVSFLLLVVTRPPSLGFVFLGALPPPVTQPADDGHVHGVHQAFAIS